MEKQIYDLTITFTEPILGTQPQKDIAMEYLRQKAIDSGADIAPDEQETLEELLQKGTTVFHHLNGYPIYYDYHVRGFLKDSGLVQNPIGNLKNVRSKVNNYVFVFPRQIKLHLPENGKIEYLERSLRAMTAQGPRVSIARSEVLPAGTQMKCEIHSLDGVVSETVLRKLLDYGQYSGFGQWRNASYGRFVYELVKRE